MLQFFLQFNELKIFFFDVRLICRASIEESQKSAAEKSFGLCGKKIQKMPVKSNCLAPRVCDYYYYLFRLHLTMSTNIIFFSH